MTEKPSPPMGKRLQANENLVWGIHPVAALLEQSPAIISEISIVKGRPNPKIQAIIDQCRELGVKVRFESSLSISGETGGPVNHQGVAARTKATETLSEEAFLNLIRQETRPAFLLALDSIQDPQNLGAILRSAAAAGVTGVILPRDRSAPLSGTTAKIAAGALAHLAICVVTNLATFLQKLQQENIWLYGTVKEGGASVFQTDLRGAVCLVIGNEEKGLRPLVAKQCDFKITIPMQGSLDSLNASVAAGISLFEVVRQRMERV
jgi:23S rRNA (guanosine2251-2'-O)-methyltransferase